MAARHACAFAIASLLIAGCASTNHDEYKNLATVGQAATTSLNDQIVSARNSMTSIGQWWAVRDSLVCVNAKPALQADCMDGVVKAQTTNAQLSGDIAKLADVLSKRSEATQNLNSAYASLSDLATYDAGQETAIAGGI